MSKAVLCPVCNGIGKIYGGFEDGTVPMQECHGCNSRGWVDVSDNEPYYPLPCLPVPSDGTTGGDYTTGGTLT